MIIILSIVMKIIVIIDSVIKSLSQITNENKAMFINAGVHLVHLQKV